MSYAGLGMGQEPPVEPRATGRWNWPLIVGWGAAVVLAGGIFYAVTKGPVRQNPRRRRRITRRRYTRRNLPRVYRRRLTRRMRRNYITAAQRRRIPKKLFVFPRTRRFPIDTARRARAALSYLRMGRVGTKGEFQAVKRAVYRAWPDVYFRYGKGITWEKTLRAKRKRSRTRGWAMPMAANAHSRG